MLTTLAATTTAAATAAAAAAQATTHISLGHVDYAILIVYFVFVLGIGVVLRRFTKTSTDFFLSGRSIPAWVAGLAFLSANLGSQEVIGMGASGAKYGIMTAHFYWVGAIPAMVFVGIFMMPFYYGSKARSVPEYLKLRFDEKTRGLNAISFAVMTLFSSGISMYGLAILLQALLGWSFTFSVVVSGLIVLVYIFLGGLTSAIYNEVLQFFLIVLAFIPLVFLGLKDVGGWHGLVQQLNVVATTNHYAAGTYTDSWKHMASATDNPMGVGWFGMVFGLGFVLSFGYWCTDFLVIQRAMAADSMSSARRTPLIAAVPKMLFPALVILPGMIALALTSHAAQSGFQLPHEPGSAATNYNMAIPALLSHYFPQGLLGLGLTALMASFMSGMAGNVTAFNTVWTYDIYQSYIAPNKSDNHYLWMGRWTTVAGIALSILLAFVTTKFDNIMDMLQLVFAFVNAPLFATFLLGMFWKRSTGHGAFFGLLGGTVAAAIHHGLTLPKEAVMNGVQNVGIKGGWLGSVVHVYPSSMAQGFWTAIFAFAACTTLTIIISLLTPQKKTDEELTGLVYSMTPKITEEGVVWYKKPALFGAVVIVAVIILNIVFF